MRDLITITEVFDTKFDFEVFRSTPYLFNTRAMIGDRLVVFNSSMYERDDKHVWEIEFVEKRGAKSTYGKTGSGNELQVFSFVLDSIRELISRYHPDEIEFGSHKGDINRSKLYTRMFSKIKIPGYVPGEVISDKHTDYFRLVKINH